MQDFLLLLSFGGQFSILRGGPAKVRSCFFCSKNWILCSATLPCKRISYVTGLEFSYNFHLMKKDWFSVGELELGPIETLNRL